SQAHPVGPVARARRSHERRTHAMSLASAATTERASQLHIDPVRFRERFARLPFVVRHGLSDHPLFALPRLIELARALPADPVEYNAGDVPVSLDPARTPRTGLSIDETIRRI